MTIGSRIRHIRLIRGMTQGEVSSKARLAVPYLSRIENDHIEPSVTTMYKIAAALGVDLVDFFNPRERADDSASATGRRRARSKGFSPDASECSPGQLRLLRLSNHLILHGNKRVHDTLDMLLSSLMRSRNKKGNRKLST